MVKMSGQAGGGKQMLVEVARTPFPDRRLNKRLGRLVEQLGKAPEQSLPQALGLKELKRAYEFLDNERVEHEALVSGVRAGTLERIQAQVGTGKRRLYLVQDTTSFDFKHHPATTGMGKLDNQQGWGFLAHTTLAVSAEGVPLGVWDQQVWIRPEAEQGKSRQRQSRAFVDKESYKWVAGLPTRWSDLDELEAELVSVGDREAHIYEFLDEVLNREQAVIVRASRGRSFTPEGAELFGQVAQWPVETSYPLTVMRQAEEPARIAQVELRFGMLTLQHPARVTTARTELTLQVVEVREPTPPPDHPPVHWLLLTTLPVNTLAQAQDIVQAYTYRWLIERFHYVLKSGCHLEARQLRTQGRLARLLGIYNYIAWTLLWLTYQARLTPAADCTLVLVPDEWQALYATIHHTTEFPIVPPTLHQVVHWLAQLGGFLGRKSDGYPGVKVLWRGWTRFQDILATWRLLRHPPHNSGNV